MVITQEELKKKFKGSGFIVSYGVIQHVCNENYTIFVYYANGNTFIESTTPDHYFGNLIDNSFLSNFKYIKLLSWSTPIHKYAFNVHRLYELKGWKWG